MDISGDQLRFPSGFKREFTFGDRACSKGYFGTDVLRGLIAGIDEFLDDPDQRWRQYRSLGPAMLGCVPWLDDPELLDRIITFPFACVVVTKQELSKRGRAGFEELKRHAEHGAGFPGKRLCRANVVGTSARRPAPGGGPALASPRAAHSVHPHDRVPQDRRTTRGDPPRQDVCPRTPVVARRGRLSRRGR